jgi:hypothetical protein
MPATPLSPERQRLALALENHASAEAHVAKIRAARINSFRVGSAEEITACERALVDAKRAETTRILADLRGEAAPPQLTVAQAEDALATAKRAHVAAEEARDILLVDLENAERALVGAAARRSRAVADVLRADPAIADLYTELDAAQVRFMTLLKVAQLLPIAFSVRDMNAPATGRAAAELFRVALAELETDPNTTLPTLDDLFGDEPPPAAAKAA